MKKITVYLLKSFGADKTGGNPAGIVLDADDLTDDQKKRIAKEVNFSETAFVQKSDKADYRVRFFTPTEEVDMCGHDTIATYSLLFQKKLTKAGSHTQELKVGTLGIAITADGFVTMEQPLPTYLEYLNPNDIADIFGERIIMEGLRPQIVSTGLPDVMLPVASRTQLFSLKPNLEKMAAYNKQTNSVGFHVFTMETVDPNAIAHARNFCPLYGIDEESATGSSTGALGCYLYAQGALQGRNLNNMKFEQGYSMNNPSEIFVDLETANNKITKVSIGGKAVLYDEKQIEI